MTRAGQLLGTRDRCPRRGLRPHHYDLLLAHRERQAGRPVYPALIDYPSRMLAELEILRQEEADAVSQGPPRG